MSDLLRKTCSEWVSCSIQVDNHTAEEDLCVQPHLLIPQPSSSRMFLQKKKPLWMLQPESTRLRLTTGDQHSCRRCGYKVTIQRCYRGQFRPCNGPRWVHEVFFWCFHWHWRLRGQSGVWWLVSSPLKMVETDWGTTCQQLQPGDSHQAPRWCL